MNIQTLLVLACLTEAIWETLKLVWNKNKLNINVIGALVVSIIIAMSANANIFSLDIIAIDLKYPITGTIFTGILLSRGANVLNDLFDKIQGYRLGKGD